jgi:hypothetical protein
MEKKKEWQRSFGCPNSNPDDCNVQAMVIGERYGYGHNMISDRGYSYPTLGVLSSHLIEGAEGYR